jgi:hypothetical protein
MIHAARGRSATAPAVEKLTGVTFTLNKEKATYQP